MNSPSQRSVAEDETMSGQTVATARKHDRKLSADELRELIARTGVEQVVDTAEAAALLSVSVQCMRRWSATGAGPLQPRRLTGGPRARLRWAVADIKAVLSGERAA
jgi:hypothetical protein